MTGQEKIRFSVGALMVWACFALALILPEWFWAFNMPASLSFFLRFSLLIGSFAMIVGPLFFKRRPGLIDNDEDSTFLLKPHQTGGLTLVYGLLFWFLPIIIDLYGDARYIQKGMAPSVELWDTQLLTDLCYFNIFDSKIGAHTTYSLSNFFAYVFGTSGQEAWRIIIAVFGMAYIFTWVRFVNSVLSKHPLRLVWILAGITAPFCLNFAGHTEIYAPSFFIQAVFYLQWWACIKHGSWKGLTILGLLLLLAIKFHVTNYLLGISFAAAAIHLFFSTKGSVFNPSWKKIAVWVFIPGLLLAAFVYAVVTDSAVGPRSWDKEFLTDSLFLPIVSTESAPLDRYNLFSLAHLWDSVVNALNWSPIGVAVFISLFIKRSKGRVWNNFASKALAIQLLAYMGAFFLINPLLSMPTDWDLFSLPAVSFMVLGVVASRFISFPKETSFSLLPALAIGLLSLSTFYAHANANSLSKIYEWRGLRSMKTYYLGSSTILHGSANLLEDPEKAQQKRLDILAELKPFLVPGHDIEYADLLAEAGKYHYQQQSYETALPFFEKAFHADPTLIRNTFNLVTTNFYLEKFKAAHQYGDRLIAYAKPSQKKALRIAIHVAVEAEAYEDALKYCTDYLGRFPGDTFIQEVQGRLESKDKLSEIRLLFQSE